MNRPCPCLSRLYHSRAVLVYAYISTHPQFTHVQRSDAQLTPLQSHHPPLQPRGDLHTQLGLAVDGASIVEAHERGVFAAGDCSKEGKSTSFAGASGALAGARAIFYLAPRKYESGAPWSTTFFLANATAA
jgi:hypothetical protein